jgi:hypothetical protein
MAGKEGAMAVRGGETRPLAAEMWILFPKMAPDGREKGAFCKKKRRIHSEIEELRAEQPPRDRKKRRRDREKVALPVYLEVKCTEKLQTLREELSPA